MDIKDWVIICICVALVLILLDGFRRKWMEHKYGLRVKLDKNAPKGGDAYEGNNELPNGGARRKVREGEFGYEDSDGIEESYSEYEHDPEEESQWGSSYNDSGSRVEPAFGDNSIEDDYSESSFPDEKPETENTETGLDGPSDEEQVNYTKKDQAELAFEQHSQSEETQAPTEEVIVINVMAKAGEVFSGKDLLPILMTHNMRLGDMSIFHRYADANGNGPIMFSMANMVKPGTFDIALMETFTTPGISFFMQLPNTLDNMQCFEKMLDAANSVKSTLNGELKDENRSVITLQTVDHSRQRIRDFELKQLSHKQ